MHKEILIGNKEDVLGVIEMLNKADKGFAKYKFEEMEGQKDYFLIVHETPEFDDYATVKVKNGKVYATSEDVYEFVYRIFQKVLG